MKVLWNLRERRGARPQLGLARIGTALAATSMGALAVGAVAIGALAIGAITVKTARIRRLEIDELIIGGQPFHNLPQLLPRMLTGVAGHAEAP